MRLASILIVTAMLSSCSITKLVKQHKTPVIDNTPVSVNVPLLDMDRNTLKNTQSGELYNEPYSIFIALIIIVLILSYSPLILMYVTLAYEYIKEYLAKRKSNPK